jgi:hypothetical protein
VERKFAFQKKVFEHFQSPGWLGVPNRFEVGLAHHRQSPSLINNDTFLAAAVVAA